MELFWAIQLENGNPSPVEPMHICGQIREWSKKPRNICLHCLALCCNRNARITKCRNLKFENTFWSLQIGEGWMDSQFAGINSILLSLNNQESAIGERFMIELLFEFRNIGNYQTFVMSQKREQTQRTNYKTITNIQICARIQPLQPRSIPHTHSHREKLMLCIWLMWKRN